MSGAAKLRSVIFDVGMVLYQWDMRLLFTKLIADPAELDWFMANVVTLDFHAQQDAGRPIAEMVAERSAQFPDYAAHIHAYATRWCETIPGPVEGSLELVRELHDANVPLFGITNFGHDFWAQFRPTAPIFELFRDVIVSGTEKLVKPDPAIYELAISRFRIDPGLALFVDDRLENVDAAIACGLQGHVFTDAAQLRAELVRAGLLHQISK